MPVELTNEPLVPSPPPNHHPITAGHDDGIFPLALDVFAIQRTRRYYRKSTTRNGILWVSIGKFNVAGFLVGIMISVPMSLAALLTFIVTPTPPDGVKDLVGVLIIPPLLGIVAGTIVGVV